MARKLLAAGLLATIAIPLSVWVGWTSASSTTPENPDVGLPAVETDSKLCDPQGIRRHRGNLDHSIGTGLGPVVMGPTADYQFEFDALDRTSHLVAETTWNSTEVNELGAVLWRHRGSDVGYGFSRATTDLDWEYVTDVTGPSPLRLMTPIEEDNRYSWAVYPLPEQTISTLDFDVVIALFETPPDNACGPSTT